MAARMARATPSRFGRSAIRPGVSRLRAKNTGPWGHSTQPTHQPMRPSQPVLARRIQSRPASTIITSFTSRWWDRASGSWLR